VLTALNIQLEGALKLAVSQPERSQQFLQQAKQLGSQALKEVRASVSALRTDPLEGLSLEEAIAPLLLTVEQMTGIVPRCEVAIAQPLPDEVRIAVYRIVQEALTNLCKYAHATEVSLSLHTQDHILHLSLRGNGRGVDPHQNQSGFGIQTMRERAIALQGRFELQSALGQGCHVRIAIPLMAECFDV
jgi:signal transduction histidine kinase